MLSVNIKSKHKHNNFIDIGRNKFCFAHFFAGMEFDAADNRSDINGANSSSSLHKFLQVELLADENVAARHKNDTPDFLLVLANIVSCHDSQTLFHLFV